MPLYRLINDPFRTLQGRRHVNLEATVADLLRVEATAAWVMRENHATLTRMVSTVEEKGA